MRVLIIIIINCSQVCINKQHCSMRFTYTYSKGHQKAKKPSLVMPLGSSSSLLANRGEFESNLLNCGQHFCSPIKLWKSDCWRQRKSFNCIYCKTQLRSKFNTHDYLTTVCVNSNLRGTIITKMEEIWLSSHIT